MQGSPASRTYSLYCADGSQDNKMAQNGPHQNWWYKVEAADASLPWATRSFLSKASILSKTRLLAVVSQIQHHFCLPHPPYNLCRSPSKSVQDSGLCKLHLPQLSQKLKELKEHPQPPPICYWINKGDSTFPHKTEEILKCKRKMPGKDRMWFPADSKWETGTTVWNKAYFL